MKKKILAIGSIVLLTISLPFAVNATKDLIMYDNAGRVKVYAGQEKPDISEDTPTVLVVPTETEEQKKEKLVKEREELLAEKKAFEETAAYSVSTINETEPFSEEDKALMDSVVYSNENLEDNVIQILKKYINEDIDNLFNKVNEESSKVSFGNLQTDYVIGKNGIYLLKTMLKVVDGNQANEEEKATVIKYLKGIDLHGIKDDIELKDRLENLL